MALRLVLGNTEAVHIFVCVRACGHGVPRSNREQGQIHLFGMPLLLLLLLLAGWKNLWRWMGFEGQSFTLYLPRAQHRMNRPHELVTPEFLTPLVSALCSLQPRIHWFPIILLPKRGPTDKNHDVKTPT